MSQAVVTFLGFGSSVSPTRNYAVLAERLGEQRAQDLASKIEVLLTDLGRVEVDWERHDLVSGGKEARLRMASWHPELSHEALSALAWQFTFDWR